MSLEFHVRKPTSLLPADADPQASFERLWARTSFRDDASALAWRAHWFLPEDDGLVLKAQRFPRGRTMFQRVDRASRLACEIEGLLAFERAGAPVPEIVAWGVERRGPLPVRALLLERRIPEAEDLAAFLERETDVDRRRRALTNVGAAVKRLHELGLFHRDLATRNVLLRSSGSGFDVWFIDCPRALLRAARWRHAYLARKDRSLLAHHMARAGVERSEIEWLLEASGEERLAPALHYAQNRQRERGISRSHLWLWSGR